MNVYQITHVRPDGRDLDRRIDAVMAGGVAWTIDQVIAALDLSTCGFFVEVWSRPVAVKTATHPISRRKYITTEGDGFPPNNLLNLPRF